MTLRTLFVAAFVLSAALLSAKPVHAQSDILLQLRSGVPAGDRLRVDSAGGVVAISQIGIGFIPASGCGDRMMWHPFKAAFRAGGTNDNAGCAYWDDGNTGFYSLASGWATMAQGNYSIAAGYKSIAAQSYAVGMGYMANAGGAGSVALGYHVTANANYSVAIGQRASTNGMTGTFVISDQSSGDSLLASAINQFSSRYAGGYRLFTNATKTTGVSLNAGGSSWNVISDRNRKEDFRALDGETVLSKLRNVPVTTWRYKGEEDRTVQHVGPMAQDWHAAFGLASDDKTINMSDLDGVNLAAVKALDARDEKQNARMQKLESENAELKRRIEQLEALMKSVIENRK
jgi:hypothetical protein